MLPLRKRGPELTSLTSDHSPRFDFVGERASLPLLWGALCEKRGWHLLTLRAVPVGSALALDLIELAREDGCRAAIDPGSRSPYLELNEFESRLNGRFRRNLRSRARKLRDLRFERIPRYDEVALEDAFELEAAAWKGQAGTAIACSRNLRGFYRELALHFGHRGGLAITFLVTGGERIAVHFALEDERAYYLLKPGYDPSASRYGPGHLLIERAAFDARRRGLVELDFLGKDLEWKLNWTKRCRQHVDIRIYRPTPIGRLLYTAERRARPAAGRLLRQLGLRGRTDEIS